MINLVYNEVYLKLFLKNIFLVKTTAILNNESVQFSYIVI